MRVAGKLGVAGVHELPPVSTHRHNLFLERQHARFVSGNLLFHVFVARTSISNVVAVLLCWSILSHRIIQPPKPNHLRLACFGVLVVKRFVGNHVPCVVLFRVLCACRGERGGRQRGSSFLSIILEAKTFNTNKSETHDRKAINQQTRNFTQQRDVLVDKPLSKVPAFNHAASVVKDVFCTRVGRPAIALIDALSVDLVRRASTCSRSVIWRHQYST